METRRWINQSQPQTLYIATMLLYLNAVMMALFGGLGSGLGLLLIAGMAAAAFGIANERKWGYYLAVGMSGLFVALLMYTLAGTPSLLFDLVFLINVIFPVALFVLLIHPQSREYQRIWFK